MVWYKILRALERQLVELQIAQTIELGAINPENLDLEPGADGRYGAVFLIRGRETEEELFNGGQGVSYFYVENWVRSDDPNPADGYRLLADQEMRCKDAMAAFFAANLVLGVDLVYANIEETVGDADSVRPRVGSRMTVKVQWSTRTI